MRAALALLVLSCCAPALPPASSWCDVAADGVTLSFPTAPVMRRVDERPFATSLIVTARDSDRVYELALFRLLVDATPEKQRELRDRVEHGLTTRPGAERRERGHERGIVPLGGRPGLALSIALDNGRRGRHWIAYLDDGRMLQLSVVGPDDAPTRAASETFLASLHTRPSEDASKTRARCPRF